MFCTRRGVVQRHVCEQSGVARRVGTRQHDGFAYGIVRRKLCLDFTRFDAEAPDLDLIVVAAEEDDVAVRQVAREIAGAVHACIGLAGCARKRIGQEPLLGQLRAVEIATRDAHTANVKLADCAQRHRRLRVIEQIDARIGDRLADRMGHVAGGQHELAGSRDDRGFGRAIVVDDAQRRRQPGGQCGDTISADQQRLQPVRQAGLHCEHRQRRDEERTIHRLPAPPGEQRGCIGRQACRGQQQRGAGAERGPEFPHAGVEGQTGGGGHARAGV
ncbi:hypothetical protein BLA6860_01957 [Burkholderia lata]|nr:hypothetical protein BLA6860_01957 [Burkholderia lata]